ncbi:hypothetical protein [Sphingosinicella sp.]|uniref:hypothetical protein n=1 Tax=Sphingosinicella sp. TaxID=1917971 RepID=UPI0035AF5EE7
MSYTNIELTQGRMKTGGLVNALAEDRLLEEIASGLPDGLMRLSLHPTMLQSFARWLRCGQAITDRIVRPDGGVMTLPVFDHDRLL